MNEEQPLQQDSPNNPLGEYGFDPTPFYRLQEMEAEMRRNIVFSREQMQEVFRQMVIQQEDIMKELFNSIPKIDFSLWGPVLKELSQYGWYVNLGSDALSIDALREVIDRVDPDKLDEFMAALVRKNLSWVIPHLVKNHMARKPAIEQAFEAHQNGLYYASVPVIFAIVEGITQEITGIKFFDNNKKTYEPAIAKWAAESTGESVLKDAFLSALLDKGAFQKHASNPNRITFTRHSVLHGETTDYGTEINSLKAFSLLLFISDICSHQFPK